MPASPRCSMSALVRDLPTAHSLGFVLGPRINAAGRIDEPDLGLRLLLCDDPVEARAMAERLDAVNRRRQEVEAEVLGAAFAAAEAQAAAGHAGAAGLRRGLASRRGRHRRRPGEGEVQPPGLRRRRGRRAGQGVRPLGARARPRRGGDRGAPGGAAGDRRRPCHGGRLQLPAGTPGGAPRLPGRAPGRCRAACPARPT